MYAECRDCGGNFDPGELTGGLCEDCIEAREKREKVEQTTKRLFAAVPVQMSMEGILNA